LHRLSLPRSSRERAWGLVLIAGLVGWTVIAIGLDNGHLGVFQDDGLYLTSARSLRDGRGFGLPSRPGEPPPKYPIGLPATIALALRLDPCPPSLDREIAIGRGLVIAGAWTFFLAAHAWLRRLGVGPGTSCGIVLATAYHHIVLVGGAITIFADLPFAGVAFLLLNRWAGRARSAGAGAGSRAFGDGLIAGFGVLLRSNGITLAFAALVAAALGPRRRSSVLACLAGLAIAVVPATRYAGLHPRVVPSNSYVLEMKTGWSSPEAGLRIVAKNAASMAFEFPGRVLGSPANYSDPIVRGFESYPAASWAFRGLFSLVVAAGVVSLARSTRRVDLPAWAHALGSMAIFLAWPWNGIMDRFLLSLIPMVVLAFVRGLDGLAGVAGLGRKARRGVVAAGLALVVLGNASVVIRAAFLFHAQGGQWPGASTRSSLDEALGLIRERTEADAVVAAFWPEMVHLRTGRTVVPLVEDEAVLVGRLGDIDRLKLWREQVPGRPFYVLVRGENEAGTSPEMDLAQLGALAAEPGLIVDEVARTRDGRYRLSRVVEGEAVGSPR
jgi:uncharacterized protein (TIGR03382 family)